MYGHLLSPASNITLVLKYVSSPDFFTELLTLLPVIHIHLGMSLTL